MQNNCFNLSQGIVMVPAEILPQEPRQCPSQVKQMFCRRAHYARAMFAFSLRAQFIRMIQCLNKTLRARINEINFY